MNTIESRTDALAERIAHCLKDGDVEEWTRIRSECATMPEIIATLDTIAVHHFIGQQKIVNTLEVCVEAQRQRIVDLEQAVGSAQSEAVKSLVARVKNLETRAPRGVDYFGVFESGRLYSKNAAVTHGGSLWIARVEKPGGTPGTPESGWQLAAKGGPGVDRAGGR